MMNLKRIRYSDLNAKQKENYNFQKVSAVLADYGFVTLRLSDDWQGADFIASHIDGKRFIRVQLKSRLTFYKKYQGKDLYIAFRESGIWYLYAHDEVLEKVLAVTGIGKTASWSERGGYSRGVLSKQLRSMLEPYRIPVNVKMGLGTTTAFKQPKDTTAIINERE